MSWNLDQGATATRRDALRLAAAGLFGSGLAPWFNVLASRAHAAAPSGQKPRSCILLWMRGGPPQGLTFDVKKGAAFQTISTTVPGIAIS